MITPTIGRVIWVRNRNESLRGKQPETAQIAFVNEDGTIHVGGFNHGGLPFAMHFLKLIQDDESPPADGPYAEWMPYQKSVAKGEIPPVLHAEPAKIETPVTPGDSANLTTP